MTLDVRVEDLDRRLDEAAARKMLLVLDERQPRLQQLVVGLHVNHVVFIQLREESKTMSTIFIMRLFTSLGSIDFNDPVTKYTYIIHIASFYIKEQWSKTDDVPHIADQGEAFFFLSLKLMHLPYIAFFM